MMTRMMTMVVVVVVERCNQPQPLVPKRQRWTKIIDDHNVVDERSAATLCCRAHKCVSNLLVRRPDVGRTFEPRKPKSVSHVVGSCCFCMGMNLLHRPHCPRSKAKQASTTQSKAKHLLYSASLTHAHSNSFNHVR